MTEELPAYDDSDATVNPAEEGVVVPFPSPARLEELFRVNYSQRLDCPTGSRFRALDLTTGTPVDLLFVRPELAARPEMVVSLRLAVGHFRGHAVPNSLVRLHAFHKFGEDLVVVSDPVGGLTLEVLLGQCEGRMSFAEAVPFLAPIGRAVDFLHDRNLIPIGMRLNEIILLPAEASGFESQTPALPAVGQAIRVLIDPLRHPPGLLREPVWNQSGTETTATVSGTIVGPGRTPLTREPPVSFAALIYRLIVGREVPETAHLSESAFTPTQKMGDQSNAFLRETLARTGKRSYSCMEILGELCANEDIEVPQDGAEIFTPGASGARAVFSSAATTSAAPGVRPQPPPQPPPQQRPLPASRATTQTATANPSRSRTPWVLIAGILILGLGLLAGTAAWTYAWLRRPAAPPNVAMRTVPPSRPRIDPPPTIPAPPKSGHPATTTGPKPNPKGDQPGKPVEPNPTGPAVVSSGTGTSPANPQPEKPLNNTNTTRPPAGGTKTEPRKPFKLESGTYVGAYTYSDHRRAAWDFEMNLTIGPDGRSFKGSMKERFAGRGGADARGNAWADIENGTLTPRQKTTEVRFRANYRGNTLSLQYLGNFDPATGEVSGTWDVLQGLVSEGRGGFSFRKKP